MATQYKSKKKAFPRGASAVIPRLGLPRCGGTDRLCCGALSAVESLRPAWARWASSACHV